jgi:hypothetical protein
VACPANVDTSVTLATPLLVPALVALKVPSVVANPTVVPFSTGLPRPSVTVA